MIFLSVVGCQNRRQSNALCEQSTGGNHSTTVLTDQRQERRVTALTV